MTPEGTQPHAARRLDPERRDRIIDRCLDVIAEFGVAGATHRRIAKAADVPLGSMTYHFAGIDELLVEAFTRFADGEAAGFESRLSAANSIEEARAAVVAIIEDDVFDDRRDLVLTCELYTLAAREPRYRTITNHWMRRSRAALERHFDPREARLLDAMIEGVTIHRALDTEAPDDSLVRAAVERMSAREG